MKKGIQSMRSIQTKIVAIIGGIIIFAMVLVGIVVVNITSKTVMRDETYIAKISSEKLVADLNNYFTFYIAVAKQLANDDNLQNILETVTEKNDLKSSPYWQGAHEMLKRTTEDHVDNNFAPFIADLDANVGFDGGDWISDDDFDLKQKEYWFNNDADIKRGYIITEPYMDSFTGSMVITISTPIYNKTANKIIGIAGIDVHITKISDMVTEHTTSYDTGETLLCSTTGQVLSSKDEEEVLKSISEIGLSKSMLDDIANPSGEAVEFDDNGVASYGVTGTIKDSGWKVLLSIPEKEFLSSVKTTKRTVIIIFAMVALILFVVMIIISKSIVAPLKKLTAITDELANGNLDAEINIHANDEVGRLADSMRALTQRLHSYVD